MKLPALWIAASFAARSPVSNRWPEPPHRWLVAALGAIVLGALLLWRARLAVARSRPSRTGGIFPCIRTSSNHPNPAWAD